jgi:hypothetical protein
MATAKKTKKAQYGESVYKDAKGYNVVTKTNTKDGPRYYKTTGPVESSARNRNLFNIKNNPSDSVKAKDIDPIDLKKLSGMKNGGKAKDGKWIQKAIKKPGALRAQLGAKPGKPIPAAKLAKAAKAKGKLGQRARLAMTLKKMKK